MEMESRATRQPRARRHAQHLPPREEVIRRIEALAATFTEYLAAGTTMDLETVRSMLSTLRRASDAMSYDEENERLTHNQELRLISFNRGGARKYTSVWLILQTVHELLIERKTVTQRELYYLHPFFKNQSEADEAIIDVGCILRVPRSCLNIFGATKGCFCGRLETIREGKWVSYDDGDEHPISQQLLQIDPSDMQSDALCIIVIEKDGIFNRLREDKFTTRIPCILVTGRGFPDLASRIFVSTLSSELNIPVYGLSDCNPFGLSIMLTYKIGSARMPLDTQPYTIDMRWIGLRPSSIVQLNLPPTAFKPLSPKDAAVACSLLKSPFVQSQPAYAEELDYWKSQRLPDKIELEALHLLGFGFLSKFVEESILHQRFI